MRKISWRIVPAMFSALLLWSCDNPKQVTYEVDPKTGALMELSLPGDTAMNWIMRADGSQYEWVDARYGWGLGQFFTKGTEKFWEIPVKVWTSGEGMSAVYQVDGIEINVSRSWNKEGNLKETYRFTNTSDEKAELSDIAINTPFNDNYPDARTCYEARCNAHLWDGEDDAYVFCTRMSGAEGGLGLVLQEGAIDGYEVRERSSQTGSSNFRGVIQLNPRDKVLNPGESYTVSWLIFPASDWNDFQTKAIANGLVMAQADSYVAEVGDTLSVSFRSNQLTLKGRLLLNGKEVAIVSGADIHYTTTVQAPGEQVFTLLYNEDKKRTRVECLGISDYDTLVNRRCQFIARHQQFNKPGDPREGAFIVYDNETESLYVNGETGRARSDCDEARERVCMGILLARQYQRTSDPELMHALEKYVKFVRRIQMADYKTFSTPDFKSKHRGYNYPWVADFWFTMFQVTGDRKYLKDGYGTLRALVRHFKHGFYCINIPTYGYTLLKDNGFTAEADTLLADFKAMADTFYENGPYYPTSEVNYEQSIVAPSIIHLLNVYLLTGDNKYLQGAESQLPLLESFGGRQPSYHLNEIAIRHWDGYWFGKDQVWGDTFPHYWSTLTGVAYRLYAKATGKQEYAERAMNIFRNNLCLFTEDGRGSCAYVYPQKVNGKKAHFYDPFANDQDWAMVFWLEYGVAKQ